VTFKPWHRSVTTTQTVAFTATLGRRRQRHLDRASEPGQQRPVRYPVVPLTMVKGHTYTVSVTMLNNGASVWAPDLDDAYCHRFRRPFDRHDVVTNRVYVRTTSTAPGSQRTFTFTVLPQALREL